MISTPQSRYGGAVDCDQVDAKRASRGFEIRRAGQKSFWEVGGRYCSAGHGFGATCLSTRPLDTVEFAFPCRLLPLQPRFVQDPFRVQRTGTARSKDSPVENRIYEILNTRKVQIFMWTNHLGPEWMH